MGKSENHKDFRKRLFHKYGGRCAYCGIGINFNEMQRDHIEPVLRNISDIEAEDIGRVKGGDTWENSNPSCADCNKYKKSLTIEEFRKQLENQTNILRKNPTFYRVQRYGGVKIIKTPIVFFFEKKKVAEDCKTGS